MSLFVKQSTDINGKSKQNSDADSMAQQW